MIKTYRATLLHFPKATREPELDYEYLEDGLLVTEDGRILTLGPAEHLLSCYPDAEHHDLTGKLIIPGMIDNHLHFAQTEMIASYGKQLLQWLESYTFPTERKFTNKSYARKIADIFLDQLFRNGTTSAMVYATIHPQAVDAFFEAAQQRRALMIAGKVCMDRNCPTYLRDDPDSAYRHSRELIERWHGQDRLYYALTPRFALTSSPQQLRLLGRLADQYPDVFIQTHLAENPDEVKAVRALYDKGNNYLEAYAHFGLLRERAVFGHGIYLEPQEWYQLRASGSTLAFCPSSNLFLGSGLFDMRRAEAEQIQVSVATDVGAGTSFSLLRTLADAYKVCQLQEYSLHPLQGLYLVTQGAACALKLEHQIGNLNPGSDADFVVLDPQSDPLLKLRLQNRSADPADTWFALSMLGESQVIHSTWVAGEQVYPQPEEALAEMARDTEEV